MISFGRAPRDEGVIRAAPDTPGCAERARASSPTALSKTSYNFKNGKQQECWREAFVQARREARRQPIAACVHHPKSGSLH
jgi:hypothetical protein